MNGNTPKTVTIEEWEVGVVLHALTWDLKETIAQTDGRDEGLVDYIKTLSGVILRLEEANGGPA